MTTGNQTRAEGDPMTYSKGAMEAAKQVHDVYGSDGIAPEALAELISRHTQDLELVRQRDALKAKLSVSDRTIGEFEDAAAILSNSMRGKWASGEMSYLEIIRDAAPMLDGQTGELIELNDKRDALAEALRKSNDAIDGCHFYLPHVHGPDEVIINCKCAYAEQYRANLKLLEGV